MTDPVGGELSGSRGERRNEVIRRAYRIFRTFGFLFLILAFFVAEDLAADAKAGIGGRHMILEAISLGVALLGVAVAALQYHDTLRRADQLAGDLKRTREDVERWRREAEALLGKFGCALDQRFDVWGLTDAEREIAVQILKGLSYKEIASVRGTAERTVRHQALAIFRKGGVTGRAEMAAHFLESMMSPVRRAQDEEPERPAGDVRTLPGVQIQS